MSLYHYSVYGHRLSSTIPLPELRPAPAGPVEWSFEVVDALPETREERLLGEDHLYGSVSARLYEHSAGHRISVDDTGLFDLAEDRRTIRWKPREEPWWDFGRSHLIGRVLATSLQLDGIITFHASAVETADGVIGFLAPKHFGKSTLAIRLYRAGARFVTDDTLPVDPRNSVVALPGVQSLRVRAGESDVERFGTKGATAPGRDGKFFLPPLPEDRVLAGASRLAALYFLRPTDPAETSTAVERTRVPGTVAAVRLVSQTKIGGMLGSEFAPELLEAAAAVASVVPVFDLRVIRDLDRLPEVVDRLFEWHALPVSVPPAEQD